MPTIVLLRHAQAAEGSDGDAALSSQGRRQAELAAAALTRRGIRPTRLLSGPLPRQVATAEPLGEPEIDERWNEYDAVDVFRHHGDPEGESHPPLQEVLTRWVAAGPESPCAQTWPSFAASTEAALTELAAGLGRGEAAVVATSAGTIAAAAGAVLGVAPATFPALSRVSVNTAITTLGVGASTSLVAFNDHSHLTDADRALVTYR